MNCCDYDCNQGRNCPARATPLGGVAPSTGEGFWPALWKMRKRADKETVVKRDTVLNHATKTVTVRYDLSAVEVEGAIRDKLIDMGWTPPDTGVLCARQLRPYPATWVGLTDEELVELFPAAVTYHEANKTLYVSISRAVEDKLREKNT